MYSATRARSARRANLCPHQGAVQEERQKEEVAAALEDEGQSTEDSGGGGGGGDGGGGGGEGGSGVEEKESRRGHSPRVPRPGVLSRVRENQSQYLRFLPTADGDHLFSGA
ncbi:hypothetical protein X777_04513 [Ooceraea biroi]|uniref:Uncharacterized protein n=1 Tax=Ooceraea biroi TaxID=2015173 RepID=A0A026WGE1_OOCBI|nr:hypothetical protein X777_04513 [Ooceraea biroi]